MSQPSNCNPCCSTDLTTQIPGSAGSQGDPGTNGKSAFSITQADFVVPAIGNSVTVSINDGSWMSVGAGVPQIVYVTDAGFFSVNSLAGSPPTAVGLTYLNYTGNTAAGNTIPTGAEISPAGVQASITLPLALSDGGTGGTDRPTAQASLGLGQDVTKANVSGLTQDLTVTPTLIAGATVTVPAAGLYLILAVCEIEYVGATFAATKTITLAVRNTTQSTTPVTTARQTGVMTTATLPSQDIVEPFATATLAAADVLELQISVATIASAGHAYVVSASLCIVPLALS